MQESQNIPHALLFTGPKDVGKFRIARYFSQIINRSDPEIIREIEKNICADVVTLGDLWQAGKLENWDVIVKSSNFDQRHRMGKGEGETPRRTDTIGVRDIQKVLEPLSRKGLAEWKVGIIRDAHRLTTEAANALLKPLEEPPKNTIIILTANHKKTLPETIASRCQHIPFGLHPQKILKQYLLDNGVLAENHEELLMIAQGRSEYLFQLLNDSDRFESEKQQFQEISRFFFSAPLEKMKTAETLSSPEKSEYLLGFLDNFYRFLRSLLVEKSSGKSLSISQKISFDEIVFLFHEFSEMQKGLRANANKKLLLEHFFLSIP